MTQPSPKIDLANLTANAVIEIARRHREEKRPKDAVTILEVAHKLWPQNGRVRHHFGLALLAAGDGEGVSRLLEAAHQELTNVDRLSDLGLGVEALGDREGAVLWFRRALVQVPTRAELAVRFGQLLSRSGVYADAETWIRRGLGLKHPFGLGHVALGGVMKRKGRFADAMSSFHRAVQTDPDYTEGHAALAGALSEASAPLVQVAQPGRVVAERMPDRPEAVIPLVSTLRDMGEEEEAVRFASRVLASQMERADKDEIGAHGIRVLHPDNLIERIGEIVTQLDLHVKMKMLGWLPPFITILLAPKERVVNRVYLDYWRPYVTIVDDPKLIEMMQPLKDRVPFDPSWVVLPDGRALSKARAYYAVQNEWIRQGRGPLLKLTPAQLARGREGLLRMGVPEGAWFVALHVREPGYTKEGLNSAEAARNANVVAYLPAVQEIVRRGGWVIRLGDASMTPLPPMPQVIDYAVSPFRSEEMDIFLMGSARFMLGTSSGPVVVAETFGVPVGAGDFFPAGGILHTPNDVIIPRPYRERATGRMLSFEESLTMPQAFIYDSNHFAACGLEAIPSEPADIFDLAIEMLERTEGKWPYDAEDEKLNARWHELSAAFSLGQLGCRVGRGFLRRHRHLFREPS